uniref:Uncharacterized protein n=1 Tax=Arundo donax TaxID=35708 RepID=A0A0A9GC22_ARUDO
MTILSTNRYNFYAGYLQGSLLAMAGLCCNSRKKKRVNYMACRALEMVIMGFSSKNGWWFTKSHVLLEMPTIIWLVILCFETSALS